jgi:DNA-binding response OmpR family regulator
VKVLLAEDDLHIREGLAEILSSEGYHVFCAANGKEALELYEKESPDFVCLDIMMPLINGYDVCRQIRQKNKTLPVIFISAKSEEIDKVVGLELGADDFIVKPFGVKEVIARIRAVTRRCLSISTETPSGPTSFMLGDLLVFPSELRARRGTDSFDLSLRDVKILELFFQNKGKVLNRNAIYNLGWGSDFFPNSRTLDQHISQLRKRIEIDPQNPLIIRTVHGAGYRYE